MTTIKPFTDEQVIELRERAREVLAILRNRTPRTDVSIAACNRLEAAIQATETKFDDRETSTDAPGAA